MRPLPLTKIFAGLAVAAGVLWCAEIFRAFLPPLSRNGFASAFDILRAVFLPALFLLPGILAVYRGRSLFRRKELKNYKGVAGSLAVIVALPLCVYGNRIAGGEDDSENHLLLMVTAVSIALYLPLTRRLMKRDGFVTPKTGDLLGRGVVAWFTFCLWTTAMNTVGAPLYFDSGERDDPGSAFFSLALKLIPFILAVLFHRRACAWLEAPERRAYKPGGLPETALE